MSVWHTETPFFVQTGVKNIEILITKTLFKVDFRCSERASCNLHIIRCNVSVWLLRGHLVSITVLVFLLPRSRHVGKEKERWGWFPWLQLACFFFSFSFLFFYSSGPPRAATASVTDNKVYSELQLYCTKGSQLSRVCKTQPAFSALRKMSVQPGWCHEENKYRCGYCKTSICCLGDVHDLTHFALRPFTVNHLLMPRREIWH